MTKCSECSKKVDIWFWDDNDNELCDKCYLALPPTKKK